MITVERLHRADRQADAVERQGIALAQRGKLRMRRPASAHVILRVHLEEADWLRLDENGAKMHRLEADASTRRKFRGLAHVQHLRQLGASNERRAAAVPSFTKSRLDRLKRAHAFWRLDRLARSLRNILPGIALIVGGRSPCAGGAGAGGAIVVALQRNAEAF